MTTLTWGCTLRAGSLYDNLLEASSSHDRALAFLTPGGPAHVSVFQLPHLGQLTSRKSRQADPPCKIILKGNAKAASSIAHSAPSEAYLMHLSKRSCKRCADLCTAQHQLSCKFQRLGHTVSVFAFLFKLTEAVLPASGSLSASSACRPVQKTYPSARLHIRDYAQVWQGHYESDLAKRYCRKHNAGTAHPTLLTQM